MFLPGLELFENLSFKEFTIFNCYEIGIDFIHSCILCT